MSTLGHPKTHCTICGAELTFRHSLSAMEHPFGPATNVFLHPESRTCRGSGKIMGALGHDHAAVVTPIRKGLA